MFVSDFEMTQQPDLREKLKTWAANLNLAAKASGAELFKINGPMMLPVRERRNRPGAASVTQRNFMGGEKFRLSSVLMNRDDSRSGREVMAILTPAELALAAEVSTMSLPLDRALEVFEGLEEWTKASGIETEVAKQARIAEVNAAKAPPSVEELRASDAWGGW